MNWSALRQFRFGAPVIPITALLVACACGQWLTAAPAAPAAQVQIARDGKSDYVISIAENASPAETLAAEELAKYLQRISDAQLSAQRGGPVPQRAIVLRVSRGAQPPRPGFVRPAEDDAFGIDVEGKQIVLHGASERAVLYAAYQFLESLGCRFLAPNFDFYQGSAEIVPHQRDLKYSAGSMQSKPVLAYRKLYVEEGLSHTAENLRQLVEWMPKSRCNVLVIPTDYQGHGRVKWDNWRAALTPELQKRGIVIEVGGHGYQNFLNADMPAPDAPATARGKTLFDAHPDWFAQDEQGARRREHNWVFNTANPDAVKFLVANVARYVHDRPEIQVFDLWPPDGERWDESRAGRQQGTPTDRMVMLTNHVREELAKVRRDVRLECIAYARYTDPPQRQQLHPDVLVDFCPINQSFESPINDPDGANPRNAEYARDLAGWRKAFDGDISLYSYYRKYAWQSLPVVLPKYMQHDLTFYASLPLQGVSSYSEPGDWAAYELNHFALARLAWDPSIDVTEMIAHFCRDRFGPAAAPVAIKTYDTLGEIVRNFCSIPFTRLKSAERLEAARKQLQGAIDELRAAGRSTSDPAAAAALQRLALCCEYAARDLSLQRMRAEKVPPEQMRAAVEQLHEFLSAHGDEGVFVIHGSRLSVSALLGRYGVTERRRGRQREATTQP